MFGSLGGAEILLILVLALLLFGPRKLPDIGRSVGRAVGEFRRASLDLKTSLEQEVEVDRQREQRARLAPAAGDSVVAVGPGAVPRGAPIDAAPPAASVIPAAAAEAPPRAPDAAESDATPPAGPDGTMSLLGHLDELRSRLLRAALSFVVAFCVCWAASGPILRFLLAPVRSWLPPGEDIVFLDLTEPFVVYMQASALLAVFVCSPYILYQLWAFVSPGLYANESRLMLPFLLFGTLCFAAGGAFGYYVAAPVAAKWLVALGADFRAAVTMRSAFRFLSWIILGMGVVFELPVAIFFLSRIGVVTPQFLLRHVRVAVVAIAVVSAVLTPTGDVLTMSVFAVPMIVLYAVGVAVAWVSQRRRAPERAAEGAV